MAMTVKCYRNRTAETGTRLKIARLPVRQTLVWFGPFFLRIAPRRS